MSEFWVVLFFCHAKQQNTELCKLYLKYLYELFKQNVDLLREENKFLLQNQLWDVHLFNCL